MENINTAVRKGMTPFTYEYDYILTTNFSSKEHCIQNRGFKGSWYVNETFSRMTFYPHGIRANNWLKTTQQNNQTAVYPGNEFAWRDAMDNHPEWKCQPIQPLTTERFCTIMSKLQLKRILVVGDSTSKDMIASLVGLVGGNKGKPAGFIPSPDALEDVCPQQPIRLEFRRENLGPNWEPYDSSQRADANAEHKLNFGAEVKDCADGGPSEQHAMMGEYCDWFRLYNQTRDKTLLLLNQGAHFHSLESYQRTMTEFVRLFNTVAHPEDIAIFRNTPPGHKDCFNIEHNKSELDHPTRMTYAHFLERYATTMYDWNLFDEYNQMTKQFLLQLDTRVKTHYLNIFNMTILRPDQHRTAKDCLHYAEVGPVDFWNHLLFTNLEDMI
jgi:hypothetical protein